MNWNSAEIERRRPVWREAAEFWLGEWRYEHGIRNAAKAFSQAGYSDSDLWRICTMEVAPVVAFKFASVSDTFTSWDPEWLEHQIMRKTGDSQVISSPGIFRFFIGFLLGLFMRRSFNRVLAVKGLTLHSRGTPQKRGAP